MKNRKELFLFELAELLKRHKVKLIDNRTDDNDQSIFNGLEWEEGNIPEAYGISDFFDIE